MKTKKELEKDIQKTFSEKLGIKVNVTINDQTGLFKETIKTKEDLKKWN